MASTNARGSYADGPLSLVLVGQALLCNGVVRSYKFVPCSTILSISTSALVCLPPRLIRLLLGLSSQKHEQQHHAAVESFQLTCPLPCRRSISLTSSP